MTGNAFTFTKAVKSQERLRLALDGPAGGGKTWTSLIVASYLTEKDGGRIAVIDSERGSARKYASDFDFDHLSLPDNNPHTYIGAIRAAEDGGYTVIIIDSLSHAWEGTLDLKDQVTARSTSKDSFGAWRQVTPVHNELVDTMLRVPAHVIATMRTKTEYLVDPTNPDKNQRVQRVGLKPVQRDGVEYEFDVVGDLDLENTLAVSKTRCRALAGAVIRKPDEHFAKVLHDWLNDGEPLASREQIESVRARVKGIADRESRNECARLFKDRFGPVESLTLAVLPDAEAFVGQYEASTPPTVPPDGGEGASTVETSPQGTIGNGSTTAAAGGGEPPAPSTGDEQLIDAGQQRDLHIDMGNIAKELGHKNTKGNADAKWADIVLDALVLEVTGGRTSQTKLITTVEYGRLVPWMKDVREGRVEAVVHDPDSVDLIHGRNLLSFKRDGEGALHVIGKTTHQPEGASA